MFSGEFCESFKNNFFTEHLWETASINFNIGNSDGEEAPKSADRELWEREQRNLDRAWYDMDAGYDENTNPFANVSEEYVERKEELLKKQNKKRKSARARQVQKVILLMREGANPVVLGFFWCCC